jgi:eukaryotic-like serine/threonine-protein kinase
LAEDDKILCVRLALFIEIMRNKPWTPDALAAIGGIHGIGVRYLEQTFDSSDGPPHCRTHVAAVRQVMKALLPPPGKDIRDYQQTRSELLARARTVNRRYDRDPDYFEQLIHVLQHETPLITPVEESRGGAKDKSDPPRNTIN